MREYTIVFKQGLERGLREDYRNPKNVQALVRSSGAIPEQGTVKSVDSLDSIVTTSLGCSWPFPQVFNLKASVLVCTQDALYEYKNSTLVLLIGDLLPGTTWSLADYWPYVILTNGRVVVVRDPQSYQWSVYAGCDIPSGGCLCDVNGQMVMGAPETIVTSGVI